MEPGCRAELTRSLATLRDGDRDAFRSVFEALWPVLLSFCQRLVPSRADAEDAAQRALIRVFSRVQQFDASRDGLTWALAIAAFEVRTIRRQSARRRETPHELTDEPDEGTENGEAMLARRQLWAALAEALGTLSDADRETVLDILRAGDSSTRDAAARKRKQRALERLRSAAQRLYGD